MVLALQSYTGFSRFSAESAIPNIVVLTLTRELGPVLTGLMYRNKYGKEIITNGHIAQATCQHVTGATYILRTIIYASFSQYIELMKSNQRNE